MSKCRVVYRPDKTVSVIVPVGRKSHETEQEWLDRCYAKVDHTGFPCDDTDTDTLPTSDREFWEGEKGKGVTINTTKKQEVEEQREIQRLIAEEQKLLQEQDATESLIDKGVLDAQGNLIK